MQIIFSEFLHEKIITEKKTASWIMLLYPRQRGYCFITRIKKKKNTRDENEINYFHAAISELVS